jgi:hypothetical protein
MALLGTFLELRNSVATIHGCPLLRRFFDFFSARSFSASSFRGTETSLLAKFLNLSKASCDLFTLKAQVDEAGANGRDLLKELGEKLDREIEEARQELKRAT